ncbi:hypothetical protein [Phytohabitans houttuyneae]|uniref:hypothetical protein n=1 Tax=Phytohabitans houttuyneae TaxID=1076126 RepID=UPI0015663F35|nr:hypothetical protein [Phytohabitans houttuyneae]
MSWFFVRSTMADHPAAIVLERSVVDLGQNRKSVCAQEVVVVSEALGQAGNSVYHSWQTFGSRGK